MSDNKLSKYGVKQTADGYSVDGKSLLQSVGGIQGIVETSLPGFVYVLVYAMTRNLVYSISAVAAAVLILTIRHLVKKRPFLQLIGSFVGIGLAIYLTLREVMDTQRHQLDTNQRRPLAWDLCIRPRHLLPACCN